MPDPVVNPDPRDAELKARNARLAKRLGLVFAAMLVFAVLQVPLFKMICERTGLRAPLRTAAGPAANVGEAAAVAAPGAAATGRVVSVRFMGTVNDGMPMEFAPTVPAMLVTVGKSYKVEYRFANLSDQTKEIQAVHSILPYDAANSFTKTQCFCFTRQTLKAHETKVMPVVFRVEPNLPKDAENITLSYTLYDLHPKPQGGQAPPASPRQG